jgi:hypothetical protein
MFEEVKEMIDSTIYTNGRGEVTAKNINLAMHGMVDATEEKFGEVETNVADVTNRVAELEQNGGSGNAGGRGPLRVWINEENTPGQIAENASTYKALMQDVSKSVILMNAEETMTLSCNPVATIVINENESTPRVLFGFIPSSIDGVVALTTCVLFADGSILIDG